MYRKIHIFRVKPGQDLLEIKFYLLIECHLAIVYLVNEFVEVELKAIVVLELLLVVDS